MKLTTPKYPVYGRSILSTIGVLILTLMANTVAHAQANLEDESSQSDKAARVLPRDHGHTRQGDSARPAGKRRVRGGLPFGDPGRVYRRRPWGRGVASCRTTLGWSAPAFFTLGGGSVGFQIGVQSTDFVMLFMNTDGLDSLLSNEFTLGRRRLRGCGAGRSSGRRVDRSEAHGQILSYSRSKGLFAGLELKGVVIKPDTDDMREVYGAGVTAKDVLKDNKVTAPLTVRAFPAALGNYSSRNATQ